MVKVREVKRRSGTTFFNLNLIILIVILYRKHFCSIKNVTWWIKL